MRYIYTLIQQPMRVLIIMFWLLFNSCHTSKEVRMVRKMTKCN